MLALVALAGTPVQALADTYQYDLLNRLVRVEYTGGKTIQYAYDAAGNRISMDIGPVGLATTTVIDAHTPNPSTVGAPIAVTAHVTVTPPGSGTPTGTIAVSDGSAECVITLPAHSCNLTPTSTGAKTLVAIYSGDASFDSSTSAGVGHTVNPGSSNTTLGASPNPSVFGQSVTFAATVTGIAPTGMVNFKEGAASISGCDAVTVTAGAAQCATSTLGVGSHGLTAVYSGDGNNASSTSLVLTQVVNKASTSITIDAHTPNPSVVGAPIAVTASVAVTAPGAGTPGGSITVSDGSVNCAITLPATACNLIPTSAGGKTLTASYAGNANFSGSTSLGVGHTVTTGSSSTALIVSANPSVFGQSVTFTATVTGSSPTGSVTFYDGVIPLCTAVALVSGEAPCATGALMAGSHSLTAVYSGDGNNASSTSPVLTQVVNKASTTTTISAHTPDPSLIGAPIAVTASVAVTAPGAGTPGGSITVSDGSVNCAITLPATGCNLIPANAGAKTLTATYAGNANFSGSTSPGVGHTVTAVSLNVDASGTDTEYDALTDGLLVIRYLSGSTGTSLTAGALSGTATRTDPAAIEAYLDGIHPALDVDGDGNADAPTDGLLIIRYLFGVRGDALIAGALAPAATRTTVPAIEAYIANLMP